ncbi:MAG: 2-dehydropantoate 2-reductase [Acidimicrobiales bacterium]
MRVVVIGAGAIGAPIAAQLFEGGHPVLLVARGANYEAIAARGVEIATPDRTRRSKVDVVDGVSSWDAQAGDVVVLSVKSQDTASVLDELVKVTAPETAMFCAQNGVANERLASQYFANTYGVCVMSPASYLEPGRVEVFSAPVIGVLDVGRWPNAVDETAIDLSKMLADSGFASIVTDEIETLKWGKLLSNIMNALEVLCGPAAMGDALAGRARDEAVACMTANGVDVARAMSLAEERSQLVNYHSIGGIRRVGSSSWQSVLRGTGNVETDYLNGEVVALGRRVGIATPVNALLVRRANTMARSGERPGTVSIEELRAELSE